MKRLSKFVFGLLIVVVLSVIIVTSSAFYIEDNSARFNYPDWSHNIASLPETIKLIYFHKTGRKYIDIDYLKSNSKNDGKLYTDASQMKVVNNIKITVPKIQSGKVAFIKNKNLWIADSGGVARQITDDININNSELFSGQIGYQYPYWSTDGSKLSFIQSVYVIGMSFYRFGYTNGKIIAIDYGLNNMRLPPYWLDDSYVLVASDTNFVIEKNIFDNDQFSTEVNMPKFPFFGEYHKSEECGGGGGYPDWSWRLKVNNQGYSNTDRPALFYLPDTKKVVYSTGCMQEVSLTKDSISKNSDWFDKNNKSYEIIKSVQFIWGRDVPFLFRVLPNNAVSHNGPNQLAISPNKSFIVGIQDGNVVLYDSKQNFIKKLSNSGKAYNPVFSNDSKTVYYADKKGSQNIKSIDLISDDSKTVFESSKTGAVSNISVSPDNKQIVFTLITETIPPGSDPKDDFYSASKEDIYIVNNDGTDVKLFVPNASQSSWSPK